MALRGLVAVWPRAAAGSRRAASSDGLRMAPDESGFHPDGSNEAIEIGGDWWRLVEIGGDWWRLVEIGGDWWRMLRFAKVERNTGHTLKIVKMSHFLEHLVQF